MGLPNRKVDRSAPPRLIKNIQQIGNSKGIILVSGMFGTIGEDYTTMESIKRTGGVVPDATWPDNWKNISVLSICKTSRSPALVPKAVPMPGNISWPPIALISAPPLRLSSAPPRILPQLANSRILSSLTSMA